MPGGGRRRPLEPHPEVVVAEEKVEHTSQRSRFHLRPNPVDPRPQLRAIAVDDRQKLLCTKRFVGKNSHRAGQRQLLLSRSAPRVNRDVADRLHDLAGPSAVGPFELVRPDRRRIDLSTRVAQRQHDVRIAVAGLLLGALIDEELTGDAFTGSEMWNEKRWHERRESAANDALRLTAVSSFCYRLFTKFTTDSEEKSYGGQQAQRRCKEEVSREVRGQDRERAWRIKIARQREERRREEEREERRRQEVHGEEGQRQARQQAGRQTIERFARQRRKEERSEEERDQTQFRRRKERRQSQSALACDSRREGDHTAGHDRRDRRRGDAQGARRESRRSCYELTARCESIQSASMSNTFSRP